VRFGRRREAGEAKPATAAGDVRATLGILVAFGIALVGIDRKMNGLRAELDALDERTTGVVERVGHARAIAAGVGPAPLEAVAGYLLTAHGDQHARMTLDDLAGHLLDEHGFDPTTPVEGWAQLHALHDDPLAHGEPVPLATVPG
jgi:hypothetical protein